MDSCFSEVFDISLPGGVIWCEKYLLKINGATSSALRSITCWTFHRISVLIRKSCLTSKLSFRYLNMKLDLIEKYLGKQQHNRFVHPSTQNVHSKGERSHRGWLHGSGAPGSFPSKVRNQVHNLNMTCCEVILQLCEKRCYSSSVPHLSPRLWNYTAAPVITRYWFLCLPLPLTSTQSRVFFLKSQDFSDFR